MRDINNGGYMNMRNTKSRSLIKDDDAMGAPLFVVLGMVASIGGLFEQCMLLLSTILAPACSSAIGAGSGNLLSLARTWIANIITA